MKVFIQGLNSCLGRRPDVQRYTNYIQGCGHTVVTTAQDADTILVWSCGFRGDFAEDCLTVLEEYQERYGEENVIACGCLPAIYEEQLRSRFKGRYFKWEDDAHAISDIFGGSAEDFLKEKRILSESSYASDFKAFWDEDSDKDASYYDQFIKLFVSEGCLYECTYCAERLAFPEFKSFPMKDIVEAV